jgi:hypothetical protein
MSTHFNQAISPRCTLTAIACEVFLLILAEIDRTLQRVAQVAALVRRCRVSPANWPFSIAVSGAAQITAVEEVLVRRIIRLSTRTWQGGDLIWRNGFKGDHDL